MAEDELTTVAGPQGGGEDLPGPKDDVAGQPGAGADAPVDSGVAAPDAASDEALGAGAKGGEEDSGARVKTALLERTVARFIDILFALLLAKLPGYIGFLSGLTYIGIADGLMGGRSIGKRLIALRVVMRDAGKPADFRASILRNSTMCVCYMLFHIPLLGVPLAVAGLALETLMVIGSPSGSRIGDEFAQTVVVSGNREDVG